MELIKINSFTWEIPQQGSMNVPTVIYSSDRLMENVKKDQTLQQAQNVACLTGIQRAAYVMPDAHQGYGFPIGGVAAFDLDEGIISPGGVGYDINCGVRLLKTDYQVQDIQSVRRKLLHALFQAVPAGVGKGGSIRLSRRLLDEVCERGAAWAVENGFGCERDLRFTEESGCLSGADPGYLSSRAVERGIPQLGTLGSGNHFLEIQKVAEIHDPETARIFGVYEQDQILVMIHCGSRGLGHQVASDYIRAMEHRFGNRELPDRQLIHAPIRSKLGKQYYKCMTSAVNFAFANRQLIAHWVRSVFESVLGSAEGMDQIYDVCHNVAKFEFHEIQGKSKEVCVHRKGATRSFGPGRAEVPEAYRAKGQPVFIPGSMGTSSYLLAGTAEAEVLSFSSTAHGAGRVMSRHEARKRFRGEQIQREMQQKDIELMAASWKGVVEEAPQVYKNVDEVVRISHESGMGRLVARLVPVGVIKG